MTFQNPEEEFLDLSHPTNNNNKMQIVGAVNGCKLMENETVPVFILVPR